MQKRFNVFRYFRWMILNIVRDTSDFYDDDIDAYLHTSFRLLYID